jgi:hypothetical protein
MPLKSFSSVAERAEAQLPEALALLGNVSEGQSQHRYAAGKWSVRQRCGRIEAIRGG